MRSRAKWGPIVPGLAVPVAGLQAGRTPPALAGRIWAALWPLAHSAKRGRRAGQRVKLALQLII